jgi:hypothetical protein
MSLKTRAAILNPVVDLLCVGGLSILFFIPMLMSGRTDLVLVGAGAQAWLGTLVNMPHFMASYRIIYRSKEMILRHKWASIYVPAILILYVAWAAWQTQESRAAVIVLISVASGYLAWHYTGQVWGMMASYAYLEGFRFEKDERFLIRTGLRILLVWHLSWFFWVSLRNSATVRPWYHAISAGTSVAFLLGLIGLWKMRRRTGFMPPPRVIVPWLAIFLWYAMMARDKDAIFWVQIAHALQYLAFPLRVEINSAHKDPKDSPQRFAMHMAIYAVVLIAISIFVSTVVPGALMAAVATQFGEEPGKAAPVLILMLINIHHYFTDGVIWHISNPEVRKELFAHVPAPVKAPATATVSPTPAASRERARRS